MGHYSLTLNVSMRTAILEHMRMKKLLFAIYIYAPELEMMRWMPTCFELSLREMHGMDYCVDEIYLHFLMKTAIK